MRDHKLLYLIDSRDNVATALGDLSSGQTVPVVDAEGRRTLELHVLSHVPRFFKVAVIHLTEGQPILKWGQPIGNVASFSSKTRGLYPGIGLTVEPGTVVHIANFVPLPKIAAQWGPHPIPYAASAIVDLYRMGTGGPFEIGKTKRGFSAGDPIFVKEIEFNSKPGLSLADKLVPTDSEGGQFGIAISNIANGDQLHLGVMVASQDYLYRGERAQVDMIRNFYRFLEGKLYELS